MQTLRMNHCLAKLTEETCDAISHKATIVSLKFRKRLILQDSPVGAVYFPLTAMLSLLVTANDEPQMEMATIGKEGIVGGSESIQQRGAIGLYLVQIPGTALRIDAAEFRKIALARPEVLQTVNEHQYALMRQILYGASCNRIHTMEQRCARWLLMTHDRASQDTFPLTQAFLSHMLGVRRASVNAATGVLKKAGLIKYVRGVITVLDRPGLEAAACECYEAVVRVYRSVLPPGSTALPR